MSQPVVLDTNLLVLLVVGLQDRAAIARHKRLAAYTSEDFDILSSMIRSASAVLLTPNTLTEASNLLGKADRQALAFRALLGQLVKLQGERYIQSTQAVEHVAFHRLGLTDAALLTLLDEIPDDAVLLTADLGLYLTANGAGRQALNWNHLPHRDI